MNTPTPTVGAWYRRPNGALLEVVAVDADDGTIEVQHFDGTLEEFELEDWDEQLMQEAQAPEDWTGSVDVEVEDAETDANEISSASQRMWSDPLGYLDLNESRGYSEWPASMDER